MGELCDYLKAKYDGQPNKNNLIVCKNKRFTVITPYLLRIEEGTFCDNATQTVIKRNLGEVWFEYKNENGILTLETEGLSLVCDTNVPLSSDSLNISLKIKPYTKWFYGDKPLQNLGGTISTLDQVNGECDIDDGICAIDGYTVMDDSNSALFDGDGWFKRREKTTDFYFFGYGHNYTECVKDYYRLTGEPELLPYYAFGNWWSRYHDYSADEYLGLMDEFRENDVPFSVGIVDMDWHLTDGDGRSYEDGWTGYTFNDKLFPDYKDFLKQLKNRNLRTALNLHPAGGVKPYEVQYTEMAKAMGVNPESKEPIPFNCLDKDFLKAYFEILHFPYERDGVDFWWLDWQQGNNYSSFAGENRKKTDLEDIKPLWMLNHMHYLASKRDNKRGMIFSRYSGFGSQRYPIGFSGDTIISWASLDFQVRFTATASNIGYGMWSHDIGGHMRGVRDDELNTRWIQFGVFSPILRLHNSNDEFTSREPWSFSLDDEVIEKDYLKLRHKLFPYIYTMYRRNCTELLPIMRPIYHEVPENPLAYKVPNEYFFGSELVVAPITEKADKVSLLAGADVFLPDGKWIDFFDGFVYNGGKKFRAYRNKQQMPIFMKSGGIVPMRAHVCHSNELIKSENMEIMIAAGDNGSFTLYEDDGLTENYKKGDFCTTEYSFNWKGTSAEFVINPVNGKSELVPKVRNYKLIFKGMRDGCTFTCDKNIEVEYIKPQNTYIVTVNGVVLSEGLTVSVQNSLGILHDNSDALAKFENALTHAQCSSLEKHKLHNVFKSRLSGKLDRKQMGEYCDTSLGGYLRELEQQLNLV